MKKFNDSKLMIAALVVFCFVLLFVSYKQKQFRRQLNEVKELPYKGVTVESLEDGIYAGETLTSFLCLKLNIEVENKAYKKIEIVNITEGKEKNIQSFINELVSTGKITVPSKKKPMLEYVVFLSCLDQAQKDDSGTVNE